MRFYFYLSLLLTFFACDRAAAPTSSETASATAPVVEETSEEIVRHKAPASEKMPEPMSAVEQGGNEDTASTIQEIRTEYARITQLLAAEELRKDSLGFECEYDPGGGSLLRYYEGDELVMMQLEMGYEHAWENKTVYLKNNTPFFVFEEDGYWHFGGPEVEDGANTIDAISENRYYLESARVIRHLQKDYEFKSWEENLESNEIPNESVTAGIGELYDDMPVIGEMMEGNAGC